MKPPLVTSLLLLGTLTFAQTETPRVKAVSQVELIALLATGSTSERLAKRVQDHGLDFTPDEAFLKSLREDGAEESLLTALKSADVTRKEPPAQTPAISTQDAEALTHLHRAAQLNRNTLHPRVAEPEFSQAAAADPANPFVHLAWSEILGRLGNSDAALAEIRTAVKLQPDLADAHVELGNLLLHNPDQHAEALEQLRQAVTLAPSDPLAHSYYATALAANGDKEGAAEQRKMAVDLGGFPVPKRIRVGGMVESAKLISKPAPHYPQKAKDAHLQGTVRLTVLIGKDGSVKDIDEIGGDPILSEAAIKAVSKWRYQPTLLNSQAVEVVTEVDVNFNLR